jgi:hypothetical protein
MELYQNIDKFIFNNIYYKYNNFTNYNILYNAYLLNTDKINFWKNKLNEFF